jgi:hypothetical protein
MSDFEYWYEYKDPNGNYEIEIYMSYKWDELPSSRPHEFLMSFRKFWKGEEVKDFFSTRPLVAGEWLRDEIGYGPAKDALTAMNIPKDVDLWKLGEKG